LRPPKNLQPSSTSGISSTQPKSPTLAPKMRRLPPFLAITSSGGCRTLKMLDSRRHSTHCCRLLLVDETNNYRTTHPGRAENLELNGGRIVKKSDGSYNKSSATSDGPFSSGSPEPLCRDLCATSSLPCRSCGGPSGQNFD
jgi:hypothetical protein